jgi:hypothetical protein
VTGGEVLISLLVLGTIGAVAHAQLRERPRWRQISCTISSGVWYTPQPPIAPETRVRVVVPIPELGIGRMWEGTLKRVAPVRDEIHYTVKFDGRVETVPFRDDELWQLEVYR